MIDPTKLKVCALSNQASPDTSFREEVAESLQRAPWLFVSILTHLCAVLIFLLMPTTKTLKQSVQVAMVAPEEDVVFEEFTPPEEIPTDEDIECDFDLTTKAIHEVESNQDSLLDTPSEVVATLTSTAWSKPLGLGGGGGGLSGSGLRKRGKTPHKTEITIARGLSWLAAHQDEDGKWDADSFMKHDTNGTPCDGAGNPVHDVGVTGLALLAFLGDGNTLRQGQYQDNVKQAVWWLRSQQQDNGLFGTSATNDFIYDHAIAALAMVEAFGLSNSKIIKKNAQAGIHYLEAHRNPYGVWRYQPRSSDADSSITGWAVMAYKSAREFGIDVNQQALNHTLTWFDQATDTSGRCGYSEKGGLSSRLAGNHAARFPPSKGEAMTAVSLMSRFMIGQDPDEEPRMVAAADLVLARPPIWDEKTGTIDHYYWYYATYALYQIGGRHWRQWSKALTPAVVKSQRTDGSFDGSWDPAGVWGEDGGRVYSTATLVLTLEAYYRISRVFVR